MSNVIQILAYVSLSLAGIDVIIAVAVIQIVSRFLRNPKLKNLVTIQSLLLQSIGCGLRSIAIQYDIAQVVSIQQQAKVWINSVLVICQIAGNFLYYNELAIYPFKLSYSLNCTYVAATFNKCLNKLGLRKFYFVFYGVLGSINLSCMILAVINFAQPNSVLAYISLGLFAPCAIFLSTSSVIGVISYKNYMAKLQKQGKQDKFFRESTKIQTTLQYWLVFLASCVVLFQIAFNFFTLQINTVPTELKQLYLEISSIISVANRALTMIIQVLCLKLMFCIKDFFTVVFHTNKVMTMI